MEELLGRLIESQAGVVARRQLIPHGIDHWHVRNRLASRRWVALTPRVLSTTTGPLSLDQRRWMAVLHAGPRSMLGGLTAAALHGLVRWEREEITVLVDDELAFEPVEGVRFFRSRRPFELLRSPRGGLPRCQIEPAVLMWAAYDASPRAARGVVAASVPQRLTTPERLIEWVEMLQPLRRARMFRSVIGQVAAGSHSAAELDVPRMCRAFSMPLPDRQHPRNDRSGKPRWTDCEWRLPDGRRVILEIDGVFHMEVPEWSADLRRARRLTTPTTALVWCSSWELSFEPHEVAVDLIALGVPGRVPESAA